MVCMPTSKMCFSKSSQYKTVIYMRDSLLILWWLSKDLGMQSLRWKKLLYNCPDITNHALPIYDRCKNRSSLSSSIHFYQGYLGNTAIWKCFIAITINCYDTISLAWYLCFSELWARSFCSLWIKVYQLFLLLFEFTKIKSTNSIQ
jgi:hypothetical protein